MWLHRHTHGLISFAGRAYYRITVAGEPVPPTGPALLVANHPNSLMDGALVAEAAGRPVRFLARAALFEQKDVGWLIRASGAIPVYRREDSPEKMGKNLEMFSAAWDGLVRGDAVGVFPEGLSHSEPSLAPFKTGAARIALGAARRLGHTFPILPMGLTFRGGKDRFRSEALVLVGKPIRWDDLLELEDGSPEASRLLTSRIEAGISRLTVNLESWDDFPLVEHAEAVHEAEFGRGRGGQNPIRWLARMRRTADAINRARRERPDRFVPLAQDLDRHARVLEVVALHPRDLKSVPRARVAVRWTLQNLLFFGVAIPLALVGLILFFIPKMVVQALERRLTIPLDKLATARTLGGGLVYACWILLLAFGLRELWGWRPAMWALGLLPALGFLTYRIRDRWRAAILDLRRFLFLRGRSDLRTRLLDRQRELAERIREFQRAL